MSVVSQKTQKEIPILIYLNLTLQYSQKKRERARESPVLLKIELEYASNYGSKFTDFAVFNSWQIIMMTLFHCTYLLNKRSYCTTVGVSRSGSIDNRIFKYKFNTNL